MPHLTIHPRVAGLGVLAVLCALLTGCAECTQVILGKGDLSNMRPPHGNWQPAADVRLAASDPTRLDIVPGKGVVVNGASGATVDIFTTAVYGDVHLQYEFNVPKGSRSGVYFMGRYGLQLADSYGVSAPQFSDNGGIESVGERNPGPGGQAPRVNASRPPGEWQRMDVVFRAPRFEGGRKTQNARFKRVVLNGVTIHENVEVPGPTDASRYSDEEAFGPLMAQGDSGPVAFRKVRITPLHLP